MHYYFLAASLPELKWNTPCALSSKELETLWHENLTASDLQQIKQLEHPESAILQPARGFIQRYIDFENRLKYTLATIRAKHWQRNLPEIEPSPELLEEIEVLKLDSLYTANRHNPLQLHEGLAHFRFHWIENQEVEPFSFDFIAAFYSKYLLMENWQKINHAQNEESIESLLMECSQ